MLLDKKVAIVHGGGGVIGGAVARAFAREGARIYLAGRTQSKLDAVAEDIRRSGGVAHAAQVDALDEEAVDRHTATIVEDAGRIDVVFHAVGIEHVQGIPLAELTLADFERPIFAYARTHFLVAKAAARVMVARGSGVIMFLSTPAARRAFTGVLGFGTTCAAIEGFSRQLSGELGPFGVRVVCLRPDALPEAVALGSHSHKVFGPVAHRAGTTIEAMIASAASSALLRRSPSLAEVADTAAFMASDRAGAVTGTVINLSAGSVVD